MTKETVFWYVSKHQKMCYFHRRTIQERIIIKSRISFLPRGWCRKWRYIMKSLPLADSAQITVAPDSTCGSQKCPGLLYFSCWFLWDLTVEMFQALGFSNSNPADFRSAFFLVISQKNPKNQKTSHKIWPIYFKNNWFTFFCLLIYCFSNEGINIHVWIY